MDRLFPGVRFADIPGDELEVARRQLHAQMAGSSMANWLALVRSYYRWANDGDMPKPIARALRPIRGVRPPVREPVSEAEIKALLAVAARAGTADRVAFLQAVLWTLWGTGFRLGELVALRVSSFRPKADGTAVLDLPPYLSGTRAPTPGLKTGPRSVPVLECDGAIRAWLAHHPARDDPDAVLFPATGDTSRPASNVTMSKTISSLARSAGGRHIHPHLFRHTRATRAARAKRNEAQLWVHFGWGPTSREPGQYVHLAACDIEAAVRAEANIDPLGALVWEDPMKAVAALVKATVEATLSQPLAP